MLQRVEIKTGFKTMARHNEFSGGQTFYQSGVVWLVDF